MLFHTFEFLIFFIVLIVILSFSAGMTWKKWVLLVASCIFYMWWNPAFILLIFFSIGVDYYLGEALFKEENQAKRKLYLVLSMCSNLGLLAFFKYFNFFSDNCLWILQLFGYEPSWTSLNIILPVGISFYTFQTMSYTIDIYRKKLKPAESLLDFSLFVSFFPQLVAGPIIRARDFLPQLKDKSRKIAFSTESLLLVTKGLVKKIIIADNLGIFVDAIYATPDIYPSFIIWIATICFSIQIYCDFSGYTDIAIGLAKMLGYDFPLNFNKPYFAITPSDFWRRWHISLSSWLKDYLYISLGGNRGGTLLTYRNLMLTMLLGGLWHGASWNFVAWGFLHGLILVIYRWFDIDKKIASWNNGYKFVSFLIMQYWVLITWITFRQTDASLMLATLNKFLFVDLSLKIQNIGLGNLSFFSTLLILGGFLAVHTFSYFTGGIEYFLERQAKWKLAIILFLTGSMLFFFWPTQESPFIYFQF